KSILQRASICLKQLLARLPPIAGNVRHKQESIRKQPHCRWVLESRPLCKFVHLVGCKTPQHRHRPIVSSQKTPTQNRPRHPREVIRHKIPHEIVDNHRARCDPAEIREQSNYILIAKMMKEQRSGDEVKTSSGERQLE